MDPQDEVLAQRIGQTIGGWTLRHLLGAGGMAAVYAADNPQGKIVAIKLLHPEMGMRREIRERFLREAAVMARIVHPAMVTIHDHGQIGDLAYLAMELLNGETVASRVRRMGRLEPRAVLTIVDQILDVLAVAHGLGVVHRDLKPENLFLIQSGRIKVLDFGLARLLDGSPQNFLTRTGAALGTLPYMAPEQALGRRDEIDGRTDLFAVGATAYRLLTGRRIHEAPSDAELLMLMASQPARPLVAVAPDLPVDVGAIVDRALAFATSSRYPDALTMQNDVRAILSGERPGFALSRLKHDELPTRLDHIALQPISPSAPTSSSNRPAQLLHVEPHVPAPTISEHIQRTALDPAPNSVPSATVGVPPNGFDVGAAHSQRVVARTVAMAAPTQNEPGLAERSPVILGHGTSIPTAPISDVVLQRMRRRAPPIAVLLLLGILGATTAIAVYVVGRQRFATVSRVDTPTNHPAQERGLPAPTSSGPASVQHTPPPLRHPAHVMAPFDETATRDPSAPARESLSQRPKSGIVSHKPVTPQSTTSETTGTERPRR